ncbi:hypothetical protein F8388_014315 [Cannabis sativa]|uniref:Uncharacterized protein n=1 Tax=Cannabis sativa TaxID=3483 RepID=A0A7J6F8J0_CANSA|nr:hypothetical protein G4B88_013570 [Cannabis sativa]KAF4385182.1 hypothetical protein F8388_014315 [Cannabis sativa]
MMENKRVKKQLPKKNLWKPEEDLILKNYVETHGEGNWQTVSKLTGNRWSLIAGRLPGRTDNEVKNYWNTHLNKKTSAVGKRKRVNNNSDHQNDTKSTETTNKTSQIQDPPNPMLSSETQKISNDLMDDTKSFNYKIENPIMATNSSTFVFDDEPLPIITYMDSFVCFEAFGHTAGLENHAKIGRQSVFP